MSKKKKKGSDQRPDRIPWKFDASIPTHDFFEGRSLDDPWNLAEAIDNFLFWLEQDRFLTWEAVACQEQGLPLTGQQRKLLDDLINFGDPTDPRILYINEISRPNEPWYVILNKLAPHLLIEPFRTFDVQEEEKSEGWPPIMKVLEEHGKGLSLPEGVTSFREVVPPDLWHKLWLQYCFDILAGLGQEEELTLEREGQTWRIGEFVKDLRQCKESVAHFSLTLESLLSRVLMPERDQPIFIKMMQEKLGLSSALEPIADRL